MKIRALIWKDLLVLTRDRRALMILLVTPAVFIAILGFSTGKLFGRQNENDRIAMAILRKDAGETAKVFEARLASRASLEMIRVDSREQVWRLVNEGETQVGLIIGEGFQASVDALTLGDLLQPEEGKLAEGLDALDIEVCARPTHRVAAALAEQIATGVLFQTLLPHVARKDPVARTLIDLRTSGATATDEETEAREIEQSESGDMGAGDLTSVAYQIIVPSYTVLFAFFLVNLMARSFLAERQRGTLVRLQLAPLRATQLLIGKTVPFLLISLMQGVSLFVFGKLLFGMSWGVTPWMLLPVIVCTSLAATSLGLLTALLVRTDAQVSAYVNLLVIALGGLSGCFMPREWLPDHMQQWSLIIPHAWALIAYDQLLVSPYPDLLRVWSACGILVLFSVAFFAMGWWRFRFRQG